MPDNSQTAGFTLIEVLLAMSLLSIMMVLLFASLSIAAKSWHQGESKITQVNEKLIVYRFFKRHLENTRPLWDDFSSPPQRFFSFQGHTNQLQFVSAFPNSAERQGLQQFKVTPDVNNSQLIQVSVSPFYPSANSDWQTETVTLIDQVESFEIAYFDMNHDHWVTTWQEHYLPGLIKIKFTLTDHSDWPAMIFGPKLAYRVKKRL